jgi:DNA-binding beta-propeller fold protein YncE
MNGIGRMRRVVVAAIGGLTVWLVLAAPAWARWGSPASFGFREFPKPTGIAVDQSSGDVFVGDLFGDGIRGFDAFHKLISHFGSGSRWISGLAMNPVNHDLFAVDALEQRIQTYEPNSGELVSSFSVEGAGAANFFGGRNGIDVQIAADANGNVYLPNAPHNKLQVFGPTGGAPGGGVASVIAGEGAHALSGPTGVAVDPAGHVWVADDGHGRLEEFEPNGAFVKEIAAPGVMAVAVDAKGDVFASVEPGSGAHVLEFNSAGVQIDDFGLGLLGEQLFGEPPVLLENPVALDETNGIFYVADEKHEVVWAFTAIGVETRPATGVTVTGATLNGAVNPQDSPVTSCEFEYATATELESEHRYGHKVQCEQSLEQIGSGNEPVAVSAEVNGLEADETYHFRLHARDEAGGAAGADESFIAVESGFGFQLSGPNALEMLVSDEADKREPAAGSPTALDGQAGSHPFDVTTRFLVNTESNGNLPLDLGPKDYYVNIPAGFAGSVAKIPRCRMSELSSLTNRQRPRGCPTASQVGVIRLFKGVGTGAAETEILPVYNMVPPPGSPAEFAFPYILIGEPVVFQVRSDGDYGATAKVRNISEVLPIVGSQLTLWGVPADPAHDKERFLPERGASNNIEFIPGDAKGNPLPAGTAEVPFLTTPTRCGEQKEATITADSWLHPGKLAEDGLPAPGGEGWVTASTSMFPEGVTGCEKLTFHPELEVKPTSTVTDSPAGLTVDLRVPQSEGANNLATPSLKEAEVTLPQGLAIAPSQARGREGCTPAQIKLGSMAQPECPNASQVGRLEVVTPLLPEPLTGQVYLSSERSGSTFHVYLVIEGQGVLIKLEGSVQANDRTGQLTSTFKENPQLPFSDLKLTFFGGGEASLATPNGCGSYRTASLFKPWSDEPAPGEAHGTPDAEPVVEPFQISSGCVSGFAPGFEAGMENPVAGSYSPFSLMVSRKDGEQELSGVQVAMPKGLVGKLAGVAECSEVQIQHAEQNTGTAEKANPSCPAGSLLGTVQAGSGPGEALFYVPGRAYLTGPYKGAPYGVVVVVPALAGPFDLGTVVVRAAIFIDPHTAQVSVKSDPLPRMLDGIPLQVRRIEVSVSRPKFTLNPTSCEATQITGSLESVQKSVHRVSVRFQVGDCASLAFKPGFKVFTKARHTKRFGAFLRVKVTSGPGQANIRSVFVKLPKALPSRVATLKGACSEKQFAENPAGCPAASRVGTAIARTPILATPLTGPAMFVSHGGAAFPDLDIVLQGAGVTVELEGKTNIHHNITTSNFKSAPDVPVSSFELTLPTGEHSSLAANGNLCFKTVKRGRHRVRRRVKLIMPTTITGQNGAVVKQSTVVAVHGCKARHG